MKPIFSIALCFTLCAGAALAADPDGWVVAVDGKWSRNGQDLRLYAPVFVNDKLEAASGTIEVALKDGQSPHRYHCDKSPCAFTIPSFRPGPDSLLSRLGHAFDQLASHRETMPVSAISRGSEKLRQAVLPWDNGRLDLADAVKSIDGGTYTVTLRPVDTAPSQKRVKATLQWNPPGATVADFPALAPGIYEVSMASAEGDSEGTVAVLVAGAADYPAKRRKFEAGQRALPQNLDAASIDAILNALLFQVLHD
jgi:hypothetical protein